MTIQSLKLEIISRITHVRSKKKLEEIIAIIPKQEPTDWWDELSEEEKSDIQMSIKESDQGKTISHKDALKSLLDGI
jgi:hypothetical protein